MKLSFNRALAIVLELAEANVVEDAETEELKREQKRQKKAIAIVNKFWEKEVEKEKN